MIALPPDDLKPIRPFIQRGKQMNNADPVITYYCYYWAVKLALDQKMHSKSEEAMQYMLALMEDLEKRKEALAGNDLVTDDMAAQAYVENFALKVFSNGSNAVAEKRATQKTPDTLLAAAVFLELLRIFTDDGQLDEETTKKIKYAKFHAARILKAIREGSDPNPVETPPAAEPDTETHESLAPPKPTVEDAPDDFYSNGPSAPPTQSNDTSTTPSAPLNVAPVDQPASSTHEYFPHVPEIHEPSVPALSPTTMGSSNTVFPDIAQADHSYPPASPPQTVSRTPSQGQSSFPDTFSPPQPTYTSPGLPSLPSSFYTGAPSPIISATRGPSSSQPYYQPPIPPQQPEKPLYRPKKQVTPEDIVKAQKFAKWAISALDYEDVDNAIEQFRSGLKALGAL